MRGTPTAGSRVARSGRGHDDAAALVRAYREAGDRDARERVVERYLPLVRSLARRYAGYGESFDDLVQVGSLGLLEAIERFDAGRGSDLAAFAIPTITGEIKRHLRDRSTVVRVPRRQAELARTLRPTREALSARLRRSPTVSELSRAAGCREQDVLEALESERARSPVELAVGDEAASGKGAFEASEERLLLAAGFRTLGPRERRILHLRFFAGLSQSEIADEVGLSQIQVSRLIRGSLERLRGALRPPVEQASRSLVRS